jgi:hypothetical protein
MVPKAPRFNMEKPNWHTIWIIGAGRFGQLAARRIVKARPRCGITLVDPEVLQIDNIGATRVRQVNADGIEFLLENLDGTSEPDWIVPAAPVHVAYAWMRRRLSSQFSIEPVAVPLSVIDRLPNPQPAGLGTLFVSNATWICPDDCPEPAEACTVTGEAHPCIVYRELEILNPPGFASVVVRSRQLLPGVGGYTSQDLAVALERVAAAKGAVLLSTACRCHAVLDAFRLISLKG